MEKWGDIKTSTLSGKDKDIIYQRLKQHRSLLPALDHIMFLFPVTMASRLLAACGACKPTSQMDAIMKKMDINIVRVNSKWSRSGVYSLIKKRHLHFYLNFLKQLLVAVFCFQLVFNPRAEQILSEQPWLITASTCLSLQDATPLKDPHWTTRKLSGTINNINNDLSARSHLLPFFTTKQWNTTISLEIWPQE